MREHNNYRDRGASRQNLNLDEGHPLTRQIMEKQIPPHFLIPKVASFIGNGDSKSHLKTFRAQMLIFRGNVAIRCKMFMGTLTGTTLKWFGKISNIII